MIETHKTLVAALAAFLRYSGLIDDFTITEMMGYAAEDKLGGRDTGAFPEAVSVYAVEGRFLYALVRALKPETVLEIGCADGGSAAHILQALERNGTGQLVSVDIDPRSGQMIPLDLRGRWSLVIGNATQVELPAADFVFEDGPHDAETTRAILSRVKGTPVVISHDIAYDTMKYAWNSVYGSDYWMAFLDQCVTGLAVHVEQAAPR